MEKEKGDLASRFDKLNAIVNENKKRLRENATRFNDDTEELRREKEKVHQLEAEIRILKESNGYHPEPEEEDHTYSQMGTSECIQKMLNSHICPLLPIETKSELFPGDHSL